jgi:hypothetical protein
MWVKYGAFEPPKPTHKSCRHCKEWKEVKFFYSQGMNGHRSVCKACYPLRLANSTLKRKYGITLEEYDRLFESQGGKCAIGVGCVYHPKATRLDVDHDHKTGEIRGLLCRSHNRGIGLLGDSVESARATLHYLEATCA